MQSDSNTVQVYFDLETFSLDLPEFGEQPKVHLIANNMTRKSKVSKILEILKFDEASNWQVIRLGDN